MASFTLPQHRLVAFLKPFASMDDLVVTVADERISAAGTMERAFYIERWNTTEAENEEGSITLGQISLVLSLLKGLGDGSVSITVESDGDNVTFTGPKGFFRLPVLAAATSSAGVEAVSNMLQESESNGWVFFGKNGTFDYEAVFAASDFRVLRSVGSGISNGALYAIICEEEQITYAVLRDSVRVEHTLSHETLAIEADGTQWFGSWLSDAIKAMPASGTITLHGGNDCPLVMRHQYADEESGAETGTTVVIAPRQEDAGGEA